MRNWTIRYKWASGTGVANRVTPPIDMHGGHEGVVTLRTTGGNVAPTRTRAYRATVAQLYRAHVHGSRYGWRIDRKISVIAQGTAS